MGSARNFFTNRVNAISMMGSVILAGFLLHGLASAAAAPDEYEDDDTYQQARVITINAVEAQQHSFHDAGDEDWVKFYGVREEFYTIKVSNAGLRCNPVIELFDDDGQTLLPKSPRDDYGPGEDEILDWSFEEDGIYYCRIRHADGTVFGEETDYDLMMYTPVGPGFSILSGTVTDGQNGRPIDGAVVWSESGATAISDEGFYVLILQEGSHVLHVSAEGCIDETVTITVPRGEKSHNITMDCFSEPQSTSSTTSSTTTTTCPFNMVLDDETNVLATYRDFRDKKHYNLYWMILLHLYCRHTHEIVSILQDNKELEEEFRQIILNNAPVVNAFITTGSMQIDAPALERMLTFLSDLKVQSGPLFSSDIAFVIEGIENGSLLNVLGVLVR